MKFVTHLRRIFRPTFNSKGGKHNLLVLIDFFDHRRGGHFGPWMHWFAIEFSKRFDRVVVVTPDSRITRDLFKGREKVFPENLSFAKIPKRLRKHVDLDDLLSSVGGASCMPHAFVMWGYDLLEFKSIRQAMYPWATLSGISWMCRSHRDDAIEKERKLLEMLEKEVSCKGFFQPDFYLRDRHSKGVWITDVENVALCKDETPLLRSIRDFSKQQLCVGVFGMLHGYRCVDEILLLARVQPKVNFVLAGKIFNNTIRKDLIDDIESGCCDNLLVLPGFIETDAELNAAISSVDAVFIDSRNYPVHSGIVCRAMHFGRWILSSPGDSWTNDVITEGDVGFTYSNREINLHQAWKKWKEGGGEKRSKDYSIMLRDSLTVAACFDELTKCLLQT